MGTGARRLTACAAISVLAACGDGGDDPAARPTAEDRAIAALHDAGYAGDARAAARRVGEVCDRLDAERENDTRYEYLVSFFRGDSSIGANAGWPAARLATVVMPILCPAHQQVLDRAVGTVS